MATQTAQLMYSMKVFLRAMVKGVGRLHWRDWIVITLFSLFACGFSGYLYSNHIKSQKQIEQQRLELNARNAFQRLEQAMEGRLLAMDRMADRYDPSRPGRYRFWKTDAANYFRDMPGFLAIQWVGKNNYLKWLYPENKNSALFGKRLNQEPERQLAMKQAVQAKQGRLTGAVDLVQGGSGFLSFHPTFNRAGEHTGFFVGVYKAEEYFQSMIDSVFSIKIAVGNKVLFEKGGDSRHPDEDVPVFTSNIRGRLFFAEVSQKRRLARGEYGIHSANRAILALVLLASSLAILTVLFLVSAYRNMKRSLEEKQGYQKELLENFEKVASSEQLLYQAQEIAKMGNWSFHVRTGAIRWSDQMFKIFPEEKSKGEPDFERHKSTIHPEDAEMWESAVGQCLQDSRPYVVQFRTIHDDGKEIWVEARGQGVKNEKGEVTDLFGTCQDVTEKKLMEQAVHEQQKVANHQARLVSLGQLAAGVGHEINNPLTIINGYLEILEAKVQKASPGDEKLLSVFGKLKLALFRIHQITQGLRNFSRKEEEESLEMNLKGEINKTLAVTEEIFFKEGVKVIVGEMPDNICFSGPAGQLQQVVLNLMMNAKDAMQDQERKILKITPEFHGNKVSLKFEDTGVGVPENIQEKIFEPFFTTKDVNEGTGLGLSLSQKIMQDHGGELKLVRSDSRGSVFEVTLPYHEGDVKMFDRVLEEFGREVNFEREAAGEPVLRALIVDDESEILSLIASCLEDLPISVEVASNGRQALSRLSESKFDVLLTDLKMPKMDGETLLSHVYDSGMDKDLKIFVMTGGVDEKIENNFRFRNIVDAYFLKPFDQSMKKVFADLCKGKNKSPSQKAS